MKTSFSSLLAVSILWVSPVWADVLTFDDHLPTAVFSSPGGFPIFDYPGLPDYHGLYFATSAIQSSQGPYVSQGASNADVTLSGQYNGVVSGANVLIGATQGVDFGTPNHAVFTLNDLYITSLTYQPLYETLQLFRAGTVVGTIDLLLQTSQPTHVVVNRSGIDAVYISGNSDPRNANTLAVPGFFRNPSVVIDNIRINESIDVPEPSSLALVAIAIASMVARRRFLLRRPDGILAAAPPVH